MGRKKQQQQKEEDAEVLPVYSADALSSTWW